jgi:tellurite resistance protein
VNIEAVVAALGGRYDADEAEVIERVLRQYGGTIPDAQLIEEAGLALAIWRRGRQP